MAILNMVPTLLPGNFLRTREVPHPEDGGELRESPNREMFGSPIEAKRVWSGRRFRDWMFREDLALNLRIGFFSAKTVEFGDQGIWEA